MEDICLATSMVHHNREIVAKQHIFVTISSFAGWEHLSEGCGRPSQASNRVDGGNEEFDA